MFVTTRRLAAGMALIGALALAGCGSPSLSPAPGRASTSALRPSPSVVPVGPPVLGIDWGRARSVERPADFDVAPSAAAFATPEGTGRSGHPAHFSGQAMPTDVAALPGGGFVAVGSVYPGWHPVAWTSPDGQDWTLREMGAAEFSFPVSLAVGGDGTVVAVGRSGPSPVAWTSRDGQTWERHAVQTLAAGPTAERMTTVIATPDGFLAGGSVGPELAERHARFWTSPDGATWMPVADDPGAFEDAEVRAIARLGSAVVAVGVIGTAQQLSGSVAWLSGDGQSWTRVDARDLAKGRTVALAVAPSGGLVAVGSALDESEAEAWTTPDGRTWTLAPPEPSRQYPGKIRMTDVTLAGDALVAVGNFVDMQYGTATSWLSSDGVHWQRATSAPVQQQGEFYAVVPGGPGLIAVGSFGAPDNYIPTVWLSPAR